MSLSLRTARLGALLLVSGQLGACQSGGETTSNHVAPPSPQTALPVRTGLAGRLTAAQHRNIAEDVLGVKLDAAALAAVGAGLPREQPSTGLFRNGADGQAAADDYPLAVAKLAALVAKHVDLVALGLTLPCAEVGAGCDRDFVDALGQRLFRRTLTERESAAFSALHARVLAEGVAAEQARRSVVEAMLQSPPFVFRLERELGGQLGEKRYLDGFELSSRLSFFLWDSAPDAELLALAGNGSLDGASSSLPALRAQVRRMLADPRARRMTRELVGDFAEVERAAFVGITPALRASLLDSMVATVDDHLWQAQGEIRELFTLTRMTLDPGGAELLGLTPAGDGLRSYDVSKLPQRVGWLTHPAFIAGMGDAQVGKIVHRGITLMVKLMCRQPVQLPDELESTTAEFNRAFADLSERQRSEQRRAMAKPVEQGGSGSPACWACHSQFEPLAYGFDRFDAAGRYIGEVDSQGRALPIDGWMTDDLSVDEAARTRYASVAELMSLLAESDTVQACMAEHFLAFGTGRASSSVEKSFSHHVREAQRDGGGTLHALVEAVASSELFRSLASSGPEPL